MNTAIVHHILRRYRRSFQTYFAALNDQDLERALQSEGVQLLDMLAERYGYAQPEAKAAWNDFVLRYVDGRELTASDRNAEGQTYATARVWLPEHHTWPASYRAPVHRGLHP